MTNVNTVSKTVPFCTPPRQAQPSQTSFQATKLPSFTALNPLFSQSQGHAMGSVKPDPSKVLLQISPKPPQETTYLYRKAALLGSSVLSLLLLLFLRGHTSQEGNLLTHPFLKALICSSLLWIQSLMKSPPLSAQGRTLQQHPSCNHESLG